MSSVIGTHQDLMLGTAARPSRLDALRAARRLIARSLSERSNRERPAFAVDDRAEGRVRELLFSERESVTRVAPAMRGEGVRLRRR